jgi:hypothetical protein
MDAARGTVFAVAGVIVLVAVATGPVGLVSVPDERFGGGSPGTGNATVTVVSSPGQPTLEAGRQGGDVYYLRVPDAEVEVEAVRGNPILEYSIDIEALTYTRSSIHFLGESGTGTRAVSFQSATFDAGRLDRETYRAELAVVVRADGTERVVYNEMATVEVRE